MLVFKEVVNAETIEPVVFLTNLLPFLFSVYGHDDGTVLELRKDEV